MILAMAFAMPEHRDMCGPNSAAVRSMCVFVVLLATLLSVSRSVEGLPFPAPQLKNCFSPDKCCPPVYRGNITAFQFNPRLPMRTRRAAQLVDAAYIAKYQKAYALLRALPDTDGRSWKNQGKLHCAYCGNAFYFPHFDYPLEIHDGWLFLPWHRLFLYFHERILAKLIGDDTFTLPFWNWDNQSPTPPLGNVMPQYFANRLYHNKPSALYDPNRNRCSLPPNIIDLNSAGGCTRMSAANLRTQNDRLMYNQMVTGAVTTSLFFGQSYRLGDSGGFGGGTLEDTPHGTVHFFTGNPDANNPYDDMGNLGQAALDPLFFAHHANIDRLWEVWKTLPGGNRREPRDPDWLKTAFIFYDENGKLVTATVAQALSLNSLRYNYQSVPNAWAAPKGAARTFQTDAVNSFVPCSPLSDQEVLTLIKMTPQLSNGTTVLFTQPLSFRVRRPAKANGEEILVIDGLELDWSKQAHLDAYLYFPGANSITSISCPEFFGTFNNIPHGGLGTIVTPPKSWRAAIGSKLRDLGKITASHIVVTLVQTGADPQPISFRSATIVYET